jgi:LacI family transcriptional regulator
MDFATNGRVALIVSGQTLERVKGGLVELVGPERDFGVIHIREAPTRIVEQLLDWRPAGVIMEFREDLTEQVAGLGLPTVVVMADLLLEGMGCVNVDDHAIGRMAARYLWDKGLRNFGFYGFDSLHAPERRTGFADALRPRKGRRDLGPVSVLEIGTAARDKPASWNKPLLEWLAALPKPAGIFAAHDPLARNVLEACSRLGLEVPSEVAILSASNDPSTCELAYPGISSVEIPWEKVGQEACRLLERMDAGASPGESVVIEPTGVRTRQSTDFYRVSDERIQKAVTYMQAHLGAEIDINAVVRAVGVDRRALERLFRAQLSKSPKTVLTEMRTTRARELLEQGSLRIGEIAERCGFGTSEKLASAFRKRFGKTPREWRRGI